MLPSLIGRFISFEIISLKDHKSHDILLLCLNCHATYNTHEANLKLEFAALCNAPIGTEQDVKVTVLSAIMVFVIIENFVF